MAQAVQKASNEWSRLKSIYEHVHVDGEDKTPLQNKDFQLGMATCDNFRNKEDLPNSGSVVQLLGISRVARYRSQIFQSEPPTEGGSI